MADCTKLLLVFIVLISSIQIVLAEDESVHRNKDAMIEVACTVYSVLDSCSIFLDSCGEACEKFEEKCKLVSFGSKYFPVICSNDTMSKLFLFLQKGSPVKGNAVTWATLKENPKHIVNYIMTNVVRQKLFSRVTSKIHRTISSIHSKRLLKKGSRDLRKQLLKMETVIDLSCLVFTMTKSCSSQLSCENNNDCRRISLVCDGLSSYSRYLSASCSIDVIYDIMNLTGGVNERGNFKDVEQFWTEMFKSPSLFMQRVAYSMLKTVLKDSSVEISAVGEKNAHSFTTNRTSTSTTEGTLVHDPRILPVLSRDTGNSIQLKYSPFVVYVFIIVSFLWI